MWGMERGHPRRGMAKQKCGSWVDQSSRLRTVQHGTGKGSAQAGTGGYEDWALSTSSSVIWTGHMIGKILGFQAV